MHTATARANANIAFIKYWGNTDDALRLPQNPSLSMNLDGLYAETTVTWSPELVVDTLILNESEAAGEPLHRVVQHLDRLRTRLDLKTRAQVTSRNNFPTGAGIASSAAAFAALTVAGVAAAGVELAERELTTLARLGSGSASRSIPTGFVEWQTGATHEESFAFSIAAPDYWDLVDVIAVVSTGHKAVGSTAGHKSAGTSDLQATRVAGAAERLATCRRALLERDFRTFADVVEADSTLMHAVMMTSRPPLFYWQPASLAIMLGIRSLRGDGIQVCYTLDAGANVHCICVRKDAAQVKAYLETLSEVQRIYVAGAGEGARVIEQGERPLNV